MDCEGCLPPSVTELTESSESDEPVPTKRSKRKRSAEKGQKKQIDDIVEIQRMLSKKVCKARDDCRSFFRTREGMAKLRQFREEWCGLHKTDQDTVVPSIQLSMI